MLSTNVRASSVPRCLIKTCMGQPSPVRSTTPFRKTVKSVWLKQRKRIGRTAVNTYQGLVPRVYSRSMQGVTRNDMHVFRQMFLKRRSFGSLDARLPCHDRAHLRSCHPVDFSTPHREACQRGGNQGEQGTERKCDDTDMVRTLQRLCRCTRPRRSTL